MIDLGRITETEAKAHEDAKKHLSPGTPYVLLHRNTVLMEDPPTGRYAWYCGPKDWNGKDTASVLGAFVA